MPLALTVRKVDHELRTKRLYLLATPSAHYTTDGDTVDLTDITVAIGQADGTINFPGNIENFAVISAPDGYSAELVEGATLDVWKLKVYSAANTQITGAADYPAGVIGVPFVLMFEGPKSQM